MKVSPATLTALLNGDLENAIISATPGGIEHQEARGQVQFVADETLPIECHSCTREQLEQMGIVFGKPVDDLFIAVQLPGGWRKVPTSHSMWSKLVDEQGRERARIFYKAAFYDRSAHIGLSRRFSISVDPVLGYDDPNYRDGEWVCNVTDCGKVVWASQEKLGPEPGGKEAWQAWYAAQDNLHDLGKAWLQENYPDWESPLAHWD